MKKGKEYEFEVYDQGTETEKDGDKIKTTESVKEAIEKLPIRSKEEIGKMRAMIMHEWVIHLENNLVINLEDNNEQTLHEQVI